MIEEIGKRLSKLPVGHDESNKLVFYYMDLNLVFKTGFMIKILRVGKNILRML